MPRKCNRIQTDHAMFLIYSDVAYLSEMGSGPKRMAAPMIQNRIECSGRLGLDIQQTLLWSRRCTKHNQLAARSQGGTRTPPNSLERRLQVGFGQLVCEDRVADPIVRLARAQIVAQAGEGQVDS